MRVLAIGGGGFQTEGDGSPIDDYVLAVTGTSRPRICLLPTPSGDLPQHIDAFYSAFSHRPCERSHLSLFYREGPHASVDVSSMASHLLAQDVIFVCGGNVRAALAIWREWGVDRVLSEARDRNILLAGMSAGAMCWFEAALTDTYWEEGFRPARGLGFVPGGCRVHYATERQAQRDRLHAALLAGAVPSTLAIDDDAAVLLGDAGVERVVSWRPQATAHLIAIGGGRVEEHTYSAERIVSPHS